MSQRADITLPDFGEGADAGLEAFVAFWPVDIGAHLNKGDDLLEIVTDKASFVVPCPVAGVLLEKCVFEDDPVHVGDVIAVIEMEDAQG